MSPTEVECVLQEHPDVRECLVFGKKDPMVQELISAVIVLKENKRIQNKSSIDSSFWYSLWLINVYIYLGEQRRHKKLCQWPDKGWLQENSGRYYNTRGDSKK